MKSNFSHKRVRAHIEAATKEVLAEVEKRARTVLRTHRSITSFCMAMGAASFYRGSEPIMEDLKCLRSINALVDEYDGELHITGIPMKIEGPDSPVITDW